MSGFRPVLAQTRFELGTWLRNYEQLLLNFLLPVAGLWLVRSLDAGVKPDVVVFAAIAASAYTGPAITLAFDRRYGVLKSWAVSPLGKSGLVIAKTLATILMAALQMTVLSVAATLLDVGLSPIATLILPVLLSSAIWQVLAIATAMLLRPEAVLAVANLVLIVAVAHATLMPAWSAYAEPLALVVVQPAGWLPAMLLYLAVGIWTAGRRFRWE